MEVESNSDSDGYITPPRSSNFGLKQVKKKGISKKFLDSWLRLDNFKGWLAKVPGDVFSAKCTVCAVKMKCGKSELLKHGLGKKHIEQLKALEESSRHQSKIDTMLSVDCEVRKVEAKVCSLIAELNLPISAVDKIIPLLKTLPHKSVLEKVHLGKQKATNIIRQGLGVYYSEDLIENLQNNRYSLFMDETTDKGVIKQLAIMVMYAGDNLDIVVDFVDMVPCPDGTAVSVYETFVSVLKQKHLPLDNWIGFCTDTTNSMVGEHNSVTQLVRANFPWVISVKCSCHLLALVSSHSCKKLSASLEDLCRNIFNHFNKSCKRTHALQEFQQFVGIKPHKILRPAQTRWLSLQQCVQRILEQWPALTLYWQSVSFEDPTHANQLTLDTLRNPLMKCLMEFSDYALGLMNELNSVLQSNMPMFCSLQLQIETLLKTMAQNFMNNDYVRRTPALEINPLDHNEYLSLPSVYLGVTAISTLQDIGDSAVPEEVHKIYRSAREFFIEAITQIKSRFVFKDEVYQDISLIYPSNAQSLTPTSINQIALKYARTSWKLNLNRLDAEWRSQSLFNLKNETDVVTYWREIFSIQLVNGEKKYTELPKLIKFFLALPFSNALVERLFSDLKNIKTDKRTCLSSSSIAGLLHVKHGMKRKNESAASVEINSKMNRLIGKVQANATSTHSSTRTN